jgi:hypothetical protein
MLCGGVDAHPASRQHRSARCFTVLQQVQAFEHLDQDENDDREGDGPGDDDAGSFHVCYTAGMHSHEARGYGRRGVTWADIEANNPPERRDPAFFTFGCVSGPCLGVEIVAPDDGPIYLAATILDHGKPTMDGFGQWPLLPRTGRLYSTMRTFTGIRCYFDSPVTGTG